MRNVAIFAILLTLIFAAEGVTSSGIEVSSGGAVVTPVLPVVRGLPWASPTETCPSCSIFTDRPFMASSIDEDHKTVSTSMGVINVSGVKPVEGATIFVFVYNASRDEIWNCRMFTSDKGSANFSYQDFNCEKGCVIRLIFCCADPARLSCVLAPCLGNPAITQDTDVRTCRGYEGPWPDRATVSGAEIQLYPTYDEVVIPPQPSPQIDLTVAFCFPLLAIFGFLAAAMYASGRDPFAMFSFYTPRYTRGAERPIQGRGYSAPLSSLAQVSTMIKGFSQSISTAKTEVAAKKAEAAAQERGAGRVGMVAGEGRAAAGRGGAAEGGAGGRTVQQAQEEAAEAARAAGPTGTAAIAANVPALPGRPLQP